MRKLTLPLTIGQLVWAKIPGIPWWPGQVMDLRDALEEVQVKARPGYHLISFFGDNKYAFCKVRRAGWGWQAVCRCLEGYWARRGGCRPPPHARPLLSS